MKVVCFHNPEEEKGFLSNWYISKFEVTGRVFSSMEQFMIPDDHDREKEL